MRKKHAASEALLVFFFIMTVLWLLPKAFRFLYFVLFGFVILSWLLRKDSLQDLGFLPKSFRYTWLISLAALFFVSVFAWWGWHASNFTLKISLSVFEDEVPNYFFWGLFQQLILCGYFTNRFLQSTKDKNKAALYSGLLFALIHLPNPVLFATALILGPMSSRVFLENRNLYILALAHAIVGTSLGFLGDVSFFSMRVGPGYWLK